MILNNNNEIEGVMSTIEDADKECGLLKYDYDSDWCESNLSNKDKRDNLYMKAKNHFNWVHWLMEMEWDELELYPPIYDSEERAEICRQIQWHKEKLQWFEETHGLK